MLALVLGAGSESARAEDCDAAADLLDQVQHGVLSQGLESARHAVALCDAPETQLVLARVLAARGDYGAAAIALEAARAQVYSEPAGTKRDRALDDVDRRAALLAADQGPACAAVGAFDAAAQAIRSRHGELPDEFLVRRRDLEAASTAKGLSAEDMRCTLEARRRAERTMRARGPGGAKLFCADVQVGIDVPVNFDTSAWTLNPAATQQVGELVKALKDQLAPPARIEIIGHTDVRGTDAYNQQLSEKRAATVSRELQQRLGLDPNRALARGVGRSDPKYPGTGEDVNRLNRRVEVKLTQPCS